MADYNGSILDGTDPVVYLRGTATAGVGISILDGGTTVTIYYRPTVTGAITSTQGVLPAGAFFVMSDPPSSIT